MSARVLLNPAATELRVAGLARLSSCDWPGELSATIFCQGCGWDCAYCHNPQLRPAENASLIPWEGIATFLESRCGLLDAVVFSGGEPTLQPALLDAVQAVRSLGFRVGIHTAGMAPERFGALLPWLDWVGFDMKAPLTAYSRITGVEGSGGQAMKSLRRLLASGVAYEVRTTLHPDLLSSAEMLELRDQLLALGVTHYAVQRFRAAGTCASRVAPPGAPQPFSIADGYGDAFQQFYVR